MSKARVLNNRFAALCCAWALACGPSAWVCDHARVYALERANSGVSDDAANKAAIKTANKTVDKILEQVGLVPSDNDFEAVETRKDLLFLLSLTGASPDYVMKSLSASDYSSSDGSGLIPWCRDHLLEKKSFSEQTLRRIFPMISGLRRHEFFKQEGNLNKFLEIGKRVSAFETKEPQYKEQKYRILRVLCGNFPHGSRGLKVLSLAQFDAALDSSGISQSDRRNAFVGVISSMSEYQHTNSSMDSASGPLNIVVAEENLADLKRFIPRASKYDYCREIGFSSYVNQLVPHLMRLQSQSSQSSQNNQKSQKIQEIQEIQESALECMELIGDTANSVTVNAIDLVKYKLLYGVMLQRAGRLKQAQKAFEDADKGFSEPKGNLRKIFDRKPFSTELFKLFQANLLYEKGDDKALAKLVTELLAAANRNEHSDSKEVGVVASELRRLSLIRAKKYKAAAAVKVDDYPSSLDYLKGYWQRLRIPDLEWVFPAGREVANSDIALFERVGDQEALTAAKKALENLIRPPRPLLRTDLAVKIPFDTGFYQNRDSMKWHSEAYRMKILDSDLSDKAKAEHLFLPLNKLFEYDLFSECDRLLDEAIRLLEEGRGTKTAAGEKDAASEEIAANQRDASSIFLRRALNVKALVAISRGDLDAARELIAKAEGVKVPDNDESIMVSTYLAGKLALANKDYAGAEQLLAPLDSQDTVNDSERHRFYRSNCLLDLAVSQYHQGKVEKAKLSLLKGAKKYLLRTFTMGIPDAEYGTMLALCFLRAGHPSLGKYTLFQSVRNLRTTSPSMHARVLLNLGDFAALEGNKLRAQRYYGAGINVLKDAESVSPQGLLKSPVGLRLASLIDTSGLLDNYMSHVESARERNSSSPKWKKAAREAEARDSASVKNRERLEEAQKSLRAAELSKKAVDYFVSLQRVADGYDFYRRDSSGHLIREPGSLKKAIATNKKALDFYIDTAGTSKWRESQIEQSFRILSKLLGRITNYEFYEYFGKLLDVAESLKDDTGGDWSGACYDLINYDRPLPEDRNAGVRTPKPDRLRCYQMWLDARIKYRGPKHKKLSPLLSNLAAWTKEPAQIKKYTERRVNLDGMTPDDKFFCYTTLAQRYAHFEMPDQSEEAWKQGADLIQWCFPRRADHSFDFLLRAYMQKRYRAQRERLLDAIFKHPNKNILERLDKSFQKILSTYLKEGSEEDAVRFVEKRVAASDIVPDSDSLSKWKLKLSELYLKVGRKADSDRLFDRVVASYKLLGKSTDRLEKQRKNRTMQAK